jgi:hypothetical protein
MGLFPDLLAQAWSSPFIEGRQLNGASRFNRLVDTLDHADVRQTFED